MSDLEDFDFEDEEDLYFDDEDEQGFETEEIEDPDEYWEDLEEEFEDEDDPNLDYGGEG